MTYQIRQCSPKDLQALQALSRQTFSDTFGPLNTPENMQVYLTDDLSLERLQNEMANRRSSFYFLETDGILAGYVKLNEAPAQSDLNDEQSLEIERIYVLKEFQNRGLGLALMRHAVDQAAVRLKRRVWLGVWEKNVKAIRFYQQSGFKPIGSHAFQLGDDLQTDIIMSKDLD